MGAGSQVVVEIRQYVCSSDPSWENICFLGCLGCYMLSSPTKDPGIFSGDVTANVAFCEHSYHLFYLSKNISCARWKKADFCCLSMARSSTSSPYQDYINKAEDFADQILRQSKHVLPHIARFCLVSTFFEDGVRMWFQWGEQRDYFSQTWNCSSFFGLLFVVGNLVGQLGGVAMVLARQKVEIAVGILCSIIVIQVRDVGLV